MMRTAVMSGSFDPFTVGHLDLLIRAVSLFDRICVAVLENPSKTPCFSAEERIEMIFCAAKAAGVDHFEVEGFDGLLADFVARKEACAVVRGVRDGYDYAYEARMAAANRYLSGGVETIFLPAKLEYAFISSATVKEIAAFGRDIGGLVPEAIYKKIAERLIKR